MTTSTTTTRTLRERLRAAARGHVRAWEVLEAREQPWLEEAREEAHREGQPSSSRATTRTTSASCLVRRRSG